MDKTKRVGALLAAVMGMAFAAQAGAGELRMSPKAVVELFTSQGCSSCPPADAMLKELAGRSDLVTLAYHVDYWDYIGWPDSFGAKANSDLQRAYAASWGSSRIYTPQIIVNGTDGLVGSHRTEVTDTIAKANLELPVALSRTPNDMLKITIAGKPGLPEGVVWLVTYLDAADVAIGSGENQGETISYVQIVTGRQLLGMWEPGTGTHLKLPLDEVLVPPSNGLAVVVQEDKGGLPGAILGAALLQP